MGRNNEVGVWRDSTAIHPQSLYRIFVYIQVGYSFVTSSSEKIVDERVLGHLHLQGEVHLCLPLLHYIAVNKLINETCVLKSLF